MAFLPFIIIVIMLWYSTVHILYNVRWPAWSLFVVLESGSFLNYHTCVLSYLVPSFQIRAGRAKMRTLAIHVDKDKKGPHTNIQCYFSCSFSQPLCLNSRRILTKWNVCKSTCFTINSFDLRVTYAHIVQEGNLQVIRVVWSLLLAIHIIVFPWRPTVLSCHPRLTLATAHPDESCKHCFSTYLASRCGCPPPPPLSSDVGLALIVHSSSRCWKLETIAPYAHPPAILHHPQCNGTTYYPCLTSGEAEPSFRCSDAQRKCWVCQRADRRLPYQQWKTD